MNLLLFLSPAYLTGLWLQGKKGRRKIVCLLQLLNKRSNHWNKQTHKKYIFLLPDVVKNRCSISLPSMSNILDFSQLLFCNLQHPGAQTSGYISLVCLLFRLRFFYLMLNWSCSAFYMFTSLLHSLPIFLFKLNPQGSLFLKKQKNNIQNCKRWNKIKWKRNSGYVSNDQCGKTTRMDERVGREMFRVTDTRRQVCHWTVSLNYYCFYWIVVYHPELLSMKWEAIIMNKKTVSLWYLSCCVYLGYVISAALQISCKMIRPSPTITRRKATAFNSRCLKTEWSQEIRD